MRTVQLYNNQTRTGSVEIYQLRMFQVQYSLYCSSLYNTAQLVNMDGVTVNLSGEQLQSPGVHLSRAVSTSREVLEQLRLIEGLFCGREVPRRYFAVRDMYTTWLSRTRPSAQCIPTSTVIRICNMGVGNVTATSCFLSPFVASSVVKVRLEGNGRLDLTMLRER